MNSRKLLQIFLTGGLVSIALALGAIGQDTTQTTSWDDWAQGFYPGSTAGAGTGAGQRPYLNCPGQGTSTSTFEPDLFYFTLFDQPNFLDWYNGIHSTPQTAPHVLPYNSQYKCYDSMHIGNQLQPAPYDGKYFFPSSLGVNPTTGKPVAVTGSTNGKASNMALAGTNCTIWTAPRQARKTRSAWTSGSNLRGQSTFWV